MTAVAERVSRLSGDTQHAEELIDRAKEAGVELVGPGGLLAGLTKNVLEASLQAEMTEHLGYERNDRSFRSKRPNSRNGTRSRNVLTEFGPVQIGVPRDRAGSFEPKILRRRQRQIEGVVETVISFAAKGLTPHEVQAHMAEVYGAEMSPEAVSRITERVIAEMADWQDRPLDRAYPVVFINAQDVNIRNGQITNRPAYAAVGVEVDGTRELLGLWVGSGTEAAEFWRQALAQLKKRGIADVSIVVCDGFTGLPQAIEDTWSSAVTRKRPDLAPMSARPAPEDSTRSEAAATLPVVAGSDGVEERLAGVLADVMGLEAVSVDSHFFDELGADSMVMTRFCARVRKQTDLPTVSIKQIYEHPTLRSLAATVNGGPAPVPPAERSPALPAGSDPTPTLPPVGTPGYVLCGSLQLATLFGFFYLVMVALVIGYGWISAASGVVDTFIRAAAVGNGILLATSILPILAKWILIGRWKPQEFRVWGVQYFRFWVVKTLIGTSPLALFAGSPIFVLYLRALGAKIGRGALVMSRHVPVCSDLLTIGDNTVVRKDSFINCYRAHDGLIQIGPVTLGRDAYVGEGTVLDINTTMGDGAQLGHSSSLTAGQSIPAGEHRFGSPAQERTTFDYRTVPPAAYGRLRRIAFSVVQLLNWIIVSSLVFGAAIAVVSFIEGRPYFGAADVSPFSERAFYADALLISGVLLFGLMIVGLVVVATVPRLLNLALAADQDYPLYGPRYWIHRVIGRMTNIPFFTRLFGDSSYIVPYLRWIGYDLSDDVVQTGSNFGLMLKHDNPYLVSIGRGSMIADGLSAINADYSDTAFRLSRVTIGEHNFLGNYVAYPSQGKTGANCLLGTKVLVPVDGEVRSGTGLLGAPSFQIPRSVQRDIGLNHPQSPEDLHRRLAAKNRHNLVTMGMFLLSGWVFSFGWILLAVGAANLTRTTGLNVFALVMPFTVVLRALYQVLIERSTILFGRQTPRQCSIYDPYFWSHERFWKLTASVMYLPIFSGTPLRTFFWRILGVRVGKRLFDDGCHIPERTMVTVGDHCTFNVGSYLWSHSQEDGAFKSDYIAVGAGCTLGVGAFVHYGVTMGDGSQLASGSFLVKGEEVPPHTRWEGNTAMEVGAVVAGQIPAGQSRLVAIDG